MAERKPKEEESENQPDINSANPFANLDEETQRQIQELQILEQSFQQLIMQKQAFQMEATETDYIIKEVEKSEGEISKVIGNQVVIKTTKEEIIEEMKHKKELIALRLKKIDEHEKEFSEKIETIRSEVMKKIGVK